LQPETRTNGNNNGNAAFEPSEVDVTSSGLALRCDAIANLGDKYSCGALWGSLQASSYSPAASNPFGWTFGANRHFVIQYAVQLPVNTGYMDDPGIWASGTNWAWEIDWPEWWGWGATPNNAADHAWYDKGFGFAVPQDTGGGGTGETILNFGKSAGANFDPTTGLHLYTIDLNDNTSGSLTVTSYIDGAEVASNSFSSFNSSALGKLLLQNNMRMNKSCGCDTGTFPAGGNQEVIRYIAVYEPRAANHAGSDNPGVVPGTTVN
jgi:hypothetical protein